MTSSLVTLLALLIGVGAAAAALASLLSARWPARQAWVLAAVAVAIAVLAAAWPAKLRDSAHVLNEQRKNYAATNETAAKQRCLNDVGRPDLVEALAAARETMPEDAEYVPSSTSPVGACLIVNMFPRRPVVSSEFNPAEHWALFDGTAPEDVRAETERQAQLPEPARRYIAASDRVILARPDSEVAR